MAMALREQVGEEEEPKLGKETLLSRRESRFLLLALACSSTSFLLTRSVVASSSATSTPTSHRLPQQPPAPRPTLPGLPASSPVRNDGDDLSFFLAAVLSHGGPF